MTRAKRTGGRDVLALVVVGAVLVVGAEVGTAFGVRTVLDRRAYVSDLRLDAAMTTFRPAPHPGRSAPLGPSSFLPEQNPRTSPSSCSPLTVLATGAALDGRSWTGAGDGSLAPVTLLTVRFADAGAARAELDRKRWAMLRCSELRVTFPPFDAPATTYAVSGVHWGSSAVGSRVRWTLTGDGRRFDFYVVRYGNTLTWTYADDASTPQARAQAADSLVHELAELARQ